MNLFGKKVFAGHRAEKTPFVIITGCAGSGKTSLGEKIARALFKHSKDKTQAVVVKAVRRAARISEARLCDK